VATPLTFGNHLKFGPNSHHDTKGRPTFLHRERKSTQSSVRTTHTSTSRGVLQRGPTCAQAVAMVSGRMRAHNGGGGFFRCQSEIKAGCRQTSDSTGIDESLAFRAFDKTII